MTRLIDADALVKILNNFWLSTSPREHDDKETALERAAMCRGIDDCIKYVHDAPTVGGWISVKDRLPKPGEVVLAYGTRSATTGMFQGVSNRNDNWWWKGRTIKHVSHWMPLPEAPKEDPHE